MSDAELAVVEQNFAVVIEVCRRPCPTTLLISCHIRQNVDGSRSEVPLCAGGVERAVATHSDAAHFVWLMARHRVIGAPGSALRAALDALRVIIVFV